MIEARKSTSAHRLLKFDLIARCAVLQQAVVTCCLAWFVPMSLTSKLIDQGAEYGTTVLIALTCVITVGALDILVNDFLPNRFTLQYFKQRRHHLYHLIAGLYFVQAFAGVGSSIGVEDVLCAAYLLAGGVSAWYSWAAAVRANHV